MAVIGEGSSKKYEKSVLTPERSDKSSKLLQLMDSEQPFTDGDLSIQKLAERLSSAPHLSQTINERMGKSFPDFINQYRIEEAKKKRLTILSQEALYGPRHRRRGWVQFEVLFQ